MKIIDHAEVLRRLTPGVCIGLMRDCLADLEDGRATQYLRTVTPLPSGDIMGYMPAAVEGGLRRQAHHRLSRQRQPGTSVPPRQRAAL